MGIKWPVRESDASGRRPSWYPWVVNSQADDDDAADPLPMTARERSIGTAKPITWWPYD